MKEYDGWTIKSFRGLNPWLIFSYFHVSRTDVIKDFERRVGLGSWKKEKRRGGVEIVKIKFIEIM